MQKIESHNNSPLGESSYDYIIAGAGCAGLSLLMHLLQQPSLRHKKILVIDQSNKTQNDRTWCFWEKEKGIFENIVYHQWQHLDFQSNYFSSHLNIAPYQYKMIRGIDLYERVISFAKQFPNVEFQWEKIVQLATDNEGAVVETEKNSYYASYVFNSVLLEKIGPVKNKYLLLQHFKGWMIETAMPAFNPSVATFMDFTVDQSKGTTFMYVLPVTEHKALIEFTLFTENLLEPEAYNIALGDYILNKLQVGSYTIVHEEFGVIPMTNQQFSSHNGRVINIGTTGGQTKASSGFTFQFIQKHCKQIITSLIRSGKPYGNDTIARRKFNLYDSVLLNVLVNKKMSGAEIFASIFQYNSPQTVLRFLDNETNFMEDLQIMRSVPTKIFLPTALQELFK